MPPSASSLDALPKIAAIPDSFVKPDTEKELKLITTNGSPEPFNRFLNGLKHGKIQGIELVHNAKPQRIITRQIDTADEILRRNGITLRIRGTYVNGEYQRPDINIKTAKDSTGCAMERGEYEDRIQNPDILDIEAIEKSPRYMFKLAAGKLDDLRQAIDLIKKLRDEGLLQERFLIDVERQRRVIRIDSKAAGLSDGKVFFGELLKDAMLYVKRSNGRTHMIIPEAGRNEMESEPLYKPCEFNLYDGCESHISRGLTSEDEDKALAFLKDSIMKFSSDKDAEITMATKGKAERGFSLMDATRADFASEQDATGERAATFNRAAYQAPKNTNFRDIPLKMLDPTLNVPLGLRAA